MKTEQSRPTPSTQTCTALSQREIAGVTASMLEDLAAQLRSLTVCQPPIRYFSGDSYVNAQRIYDARRKADRITNIEGFSASPAFDGLLDLYINAAAGRMVSVSSACIGIACPPTTALRWLQFLEQQGLVTRTPDPFDQRRVHVSLTREGLKKVEEAIAHYNISQ